MCGTERNFSLGLIQNLKDEVKKSKEDCKGEVINLFKKIVTAIEVYTDTLSVNKGLDVLAVHFADMEAKLSTITKERDKLMNTVHDLKAENKQLSTKISPTVQEGMNKPHIRKTNGNSRKSKEFIENTVIESESDEVMIIGSENESEEEQNQDSLYDLDDYECNEVEPEVVIKEIEQSQSNGDVTLPNNLTQLPIEEGYDRKNVNDRHDAAIFDLFKPKVETRPTNKKGSKWLICEQCPYSTGKKYNMRSHVEAIHEKVIKYHCKQCNYGTSRKHRLETHFDAIHNTGDKKFKCEKCPYSAPRRNYLKNHLESVHKEIWS